jgi:DNA-binding GntR family transcriptional regulator
MPAETTISRSVLRETIRDRLLEAILDGRYAPGSRIVETRAAKEFGTSQAPVREALRDLEGLGVVEINAFRGARVRHPSRAELLEAYAVRTELEALAVRLAIPRLTEASLGRLDGLLAEMHRCATIGDTVGEATADAAFHGSIVDAANNLTLKRVWGRLEPYSRTYITIAVHGADREGIASLHDPVLAALRALDPVRADEAIRRHFATAERMLAEHWTDESPADDAPDATEPSTARRPRRAEARPVPPTARASERTA